MKWSILICTLPVRKASFTKLVEHLSAQIQAASLQDRVEVLHFLDNKENSVGAKRAELHQRATGEYLCFIDDDDWVSDWYIERIYEGLLTRPDCVSLTGIMTRRGRDPRTFIHSIKYDRYFEEDRIYYRPPNHLNPVRTDLARKVPFQDLRHREDQRWTLDMHQSGLLKNEYEINEPYYFYQFDPSKSQTLRDMRRRTDLQR